MMVPNCDYQMRHMRGEIRKRKGIILTKEKISGDNIIRKNKLFEKQQNMSRKRMEEDKG